MGAIETATNLLALFVGLIPGLTPGLLLSIFKLETDPTDFHIKGEKVMEADVEPEAETGAEAEAEAGVEVEAGVVGAVPKA